MTGLSSGTASRRVPDSAQPKPGAVVLGGVFTPSANMAHARLVLAGLLRGLRGTTGVCPCRPEALAACSRGLHGSAWTQHVQPSPVEDSTDGAPAEPRWLREPGAIRTDWT